MLPLIDGFDIIRKLKNYTLNVEKGQSEELWFPATALSYIDQLKSLKHSLIGHDMESNILFAQDRPTKFTVFNSYSYSSILETLQQKSFLGYISDDLEHTLRGRGNQVGMPYESIMVDTHLIDNDLKPQFEQSPSIGIRYKKIYSIPEFYADKEIEGYIRFYVDLDIKVSNLGIRTKGKLEIKSGSINYSDPETISLLWSQQVNYNDSLDELINQYSMQRYYCRYSDKLCTSTVTLGSGLENEDINGAYRLDFQKLVEENKKQLSSFAFHRGDVTVMFTLYPSLIINTFDDTGILPAPFGAELTFMFNQKKDSRV
jgi:hypothetical protein